jgi:integrase
MASFRKRGELQWQARIARKGFPAQVKTFDTRVDAEAWARQVESEMDRGIFVSRTEAETTSLREALERYQREISPLKRGAYHESFVIKAWLGCHFSSRMMASIRSADIASLRDQWLKELKPATVNRRLSLGSHLFNVGRREWGMESLVNPFELIRKPQAQNARTRRLTEKTATTGSMSGTEVDHIKAASESPTLAAIIDLAIETAMRRSEIVALEWEHIDLESRVAHLPMTKNGSARDVPLSPKAASLLAALPRTGGKPFDMRADAITRAFVRARERARKDYEMSSLQAGRKPDARFLTDLRFHDLRHEATSRLASIFPLHELTRITGHKDPRMLMRYYHPRAADLAKKLELHT